MFIQISWSRIGKPYNYAEFLCETDSDVAALPTQKGKCAVGSKAFVLSSSKTYILNNNNQWVVYNASSDKDGFSPTVDVTPISGGHKVTITDKEGQHSFDVMDGTGSLGMVVTATPIGNEQYLIDSTYDDIKAALAQGKTVVMVDSSDENHTPQSYIGNVYLDDMWNLAFGVSTTFDNTAVFQGFMVLEAYQNIAIWTEELTPIPQITDVQINGTSIVENGVANISIVKGVDYWTNADKTEIVFDVETDLQPTITSIENTANTAKRIAEGANQSLSYVNYQAMITAFNALDDDAYKAGQNVMIITLNVPDLWISSIESTSQTYTYTTDAAFINGLETNGYVQVGYYRLSALETQKVDLTNYYTKTQTDNLLSAKVDKSSFVYDSNTETLSITIS